MTRSQLYVLLSALGLGLLGGFLGGQLSSSSPAHQQAHFATAQGASLPTGYGSTAALPDKPTQFGVAAQRGTQSVVFIRTVSNSHRSNERYWSFWDYFGDRGPNIATGSGVIYSADGYIITNNHVVEQAEEIEVTLTNKHIYPARVIGTDPNTDLALLKIDAEGLTPLPLSNSDGVGIGDWVLAVGNPLNLTYTVTAGIVSAKGRNINLLNSQFPIESFIQTDAAINPGNSGGALVNLEGQLIGINTAIATRNGGYSGYGFAIPSNIVRKVIEDLKEHGIVQRAFMGAEVLDIDSRLADRLQGDDYTGVLVDFVSDESAAAMAGLQADDVILAINGQPVNTKAEYLERLSYHSPGDVLKLTIRRGGREQDLAATLQNIQGGTGDIEDLSVRSESLGASFTPLSKVEQQKYGVQAGYRVSNIRRGLIAQMRLPEGFVILTVNRYAPENTQELIKLLESASGRVVIEGVNTNGARGYITYYR